jgi:hypothetical protein
LIYSDSLAWDEKIKTRAWASRVATTAYGQRWPGRHHPENENTIRNDLGNFLQHFQEGRAQPNLDRPDRPAALGSAQVHKQTGWGLLQLTRLDQTMLLERLDLWVWLCPPPPDNRTITFQLGSGQL